MSHLGLQKAARIRAIHAACRAMGIDDDTRRALQRQLTGKDSLSDMLLGEVIRVLDHLNARKAKAPAHEWSFVFRLTPDRQLHARKIYRLAQKIGALQTPPVAVATKAYIEGIASQMRGCDTKLEFCDPEQLHKIVQALEVYAKRHGAK